jgi:hypothetical protein
VKSDKVVSFALGVLLLFVLLVLNGWALETLWNWYVAPAGMRKLSFTIAVGVMLTYFFVFEKALGPLDAANMTRREVGARILRPVVFVLLGAAWKLFSPLLPSAILSL